MSKNLTFANMARSFGPNTLLLCQKFGVAAMHPRGILTAYHSARVEYSTQPSPIAWEPLPQVWGLHFDRNSVPRNVFLTAELTLPGAMSSPLYDASYHLINRTDDGKRKLRRRAEAIATPDKPLDQIERSLRNESIDTRDDHIHELMVTADLWTRECADGSTLDYSAPQLTKAQRLLELSARYAVSADFKAIIMEYLHATLPPDKRTPEMTARVIDAWELTLGNPADVTCEPLRIFQGVLLCMQHPGTVHRAVPFLQRSIELQDNMPERSLDVIDDHLRIIQVLIGSGNPYLDHWRLASDYLTSAQSRMAIMLEEYKGTGISATAAKQFGHRYLTVKIMAKYICNVVQMGELRVKQADALQRAADAARSAHANPFDQLLDTPLNQISAEELEALVLALEKKAEGVRPR